MQKLLTFFRKNVNIFCIFSDQNFNDTLTNDIVSFEKTGPWFLFIMLWVLIRNLRCGFSSVTKVLVLIRRASPIGF